MSLDGPVQKERGRRVISRDQGGPGDDQVSPARRVDAVSGGRLGLILERWRPGVVINLSNSNTFRWPRDGPAWNRLAWRRTALGVFSDRSRPASPSNSPGDHPASLPCNQPDAASRAVSPPLRLRSNCSVAFSERRSLFLLRAQLIPQWIRTSIRRLTSTARRRPRVACAHGAERLLPPR